MQRYDVNDVKRSTLSPGPGHTFLSYTYVGSAVLEVISCFVHWRGNVLSVNMVASDNEARRCSQVRDVIVIVENILDDANGCAWNSQ